MVLSAAPPSLSRARRTSAVVRNHAESLDIFLQADLQKFSVKMIQTSPRVSWSIADSSVSLISPSLSLFTPIYDRLGRVVAPGKFLPFLIIHI